jgi:DNA polymerase I-like protein with 3'-5' exonuclease and polymerase domains
MCRAFPYLVEALDRTRTLDVYEADRSMALLALQMTRTGMPIDLVERERVGDHLRQIRDESLEKLRPYTTGEYEEAFINWVAQFMAAKARKDDPQAGQEVAGVVYSDETAFKARVAIRQEEFKETLAKDGVNFGAKVQQAAILRAAGVPLLKVTEKTGLPKINKETLEEQGHHPAARALLDYSLTGAAIRTFIDGLEVGPDGCLHPDWSVHKITGRWGSSPNVQNVSKRAGGGVENLRRMFAAPEGFVIVGADQKQLEARLIAAAAQDPFLIDVFKRGADIHSELAGVAFAAIWPKLAETYKKHKGQKCGPSADQPKCDDCKQRDKIRDLTKRLEYGAFYGGSAETLWSSCVKDFPDLKLNAIVAFLTTVGQRMKGVIEWRQRVLQVAIKEGEIRSPILGRRQAFPLGRVEPTVAYNYIPQSGGADLWALGAIEFCQRWDQTKDEARIFHNGHDSVMILCREALAPRIEQDVHECWEREWGGVPFLMDCKTGKRWSEV